MFFCIPNKAKEIYSVTKGSQFLVLKSNCRLQSLGTQSLVRDLPHWTHPTSEKQQPFSFIPSSGVGLPFLSRSAENLCTLCIVIPVPQSRPSLNSAFGSCGAQSKPSSLLSVEEAFFQKEREAVQKLHR